MIKPISIGGSGLSESLATTWTPLTGTALELRAIQRAVGADQVSGFTSVEASKSRLLSLRRPGILHLATHAFYIPRATVAVAPSDSGEPIRMGISTELRTGVVLAGANERHHLGDSAMDDGVVTALELTTVLDLSTTELVVLSACETAVGDLRFGDSVHGVRHACHTAGAQAVVACLWSVTDDGAAGIVGSMYTKLAAHAPPAEALHEATREELEAARADGRTPHPYSWAAFVISGGVKAVRRPVL